MISGMRRRKIKEICKIKRSSRLGGRGRVERFQTPAHLRGYLESLYPTHDV